MPADVHALELQNRFDEPVRVRLASGGFPLWDAWLPSRGQLRIPAFPAGRMSLEALCFDELSQVASTTRVDKLAAGTQVSVLMRIDRGAPLFLLEAVEGAGERTLRVCNRVRRAVDLVVRFDGGPFVLRACVPPGGEWILDSAAGFDLAVTHAGLTVRQPLNRAAGRWTVGPGDRWPGPCINASP